MKIAGLHVHRHVVTHAHHHVSLGVDRQVVRNLLDKIAVAVVKKIFWTYFFSPVMLIVPLRIVRCPFRPGIGFASALCIVVRLVGPAVRVGLIGAVIQIGLIGSVVRIVLVCPVIQLRLRMCFAGNLFHCHSPF